MIETFKCVNCGAIEGDAIGEVNFNIKSQVCDICCHDLYADEDDE